LRVGGWGGGTGTLPRGLPVIVPPPGHPRPGAALPRGAETGAGVSPLHLPPRRSGRWAPRGRAGAPAARPGEELLVTAESFVAAVRPPVPAALGGGRRIPPGQSAGRAGPGQERVKVYIIQERSC